MEVRTRPCEPVDHEAVIALSLRAWAPVFASFRAVLGPAIYDHLFPDWPHQQREVVARALDDPTREAWVAERDGIVAGFVVIVENVVDRAGEVELLAVDPAHQRRGVGTALNRLALDRIRARGFALAVVGTGGDPGHAPARRAYEKAGYIALPIVRYLQYLGPDGPGDAGASSPAEENA